LTHTIIHLPETNSTNSYAIELLLKARPEEVCVIIADQQTKGKGTDTNIWESEKGKNLTFSIILYPTIAADQQFILNKAISLGIYDFLVTLLPGHKVSIKWPNDIYIENKKACGILIQNSVIGNMLDYMVVGIGLNVNQIHFTGDAPNPVSLKMVTGIEYNLDELLQKLLHSIFERYSYAGPETTKKIDSAYQNALYRLEEWHEYLVNDNKVFAKIIGTTAYGQLVLENESGKKIVCDLKEVKFII
jgi:BirA family biotin operon repressor/biotin-[acetyl-CoA-carboxylase] ligase